ncbi:MAG: COQ9 family protein [Pseudomonadota bacterium]
MVDSSEKSDAVEAQLLEAITPHVPFDGWSETSFRAAVTDAGIDMSAARAACPRGAVNLALAFHRQGDAEMERRLVAKEFGEERFRDKVIFAIRTRLDLIEDRELVRRGATLFSLPPYAADGATAIWGTADLILRSLGDQSDDLNWYTKRATLAGVYSATVLYWLGDDSPDQQRTWDFLDRRIEGVMQIEKVKSRLRQNRLTRAMMAGPDWLASKVRPPSPSSGLPGTSTPPA